MYKGRQESILEHCYEIGRKLSRALLNRERVTDRLLASSVSRAPRRTRTSRAPVVLEQHPVHLVKANLEKLFLRVRHRGLLQISLQMLQLLQQPPAVAVQSRCLSCSCLSCCFLACSLGRFLLQCLLSSSSSSLLTTKIRQPLARRVQSCHHRNRRCRTKCCSR